jgi:hypothetical protein
MDELETSRHISSNVTHSGDIEAMQQITFTAMRIAVVTCKVKPPSADMPTDEYEDLTDRIKLSSPASTLSIGAGNAYGPQSSSNGGQYLQNSFVPSGYRLPAQASQDNDFVREVVQLCNFHGKSKQELVELLTQAPESIFASLSLSNHQPHLNNTHGTLNNLALSKAFNLNNLVLAGGHDLSPSYSSNYPPSNSSSLHQYSPHGLTPYDSYGTNQSSPQATTTTMLSPLAMPPNGGAFAAQNDCSESGGSQQAPFSPTDHMATTPMYLDATSTTTQPDSLDGSQQMYNHHHHHIS